jgi:hypothetical protein
MSSQANTLWFSRISFAVAGLALVSMIPSGCQEDGVSAEPPAAAMKLERRVGETATAEASDSKPRSAPRKAPEERRKTRTARTAKQPPAPPKDGKSGQTPPAPSRDQRAAEQPAGGEGASLAPLRLERLVITNSIEAREPAVALQTTTVAEPVIAFVELASGEGQPQQITLRFEHESGKQVGFVKLDIPADQRRWRTWGRTRQVRLPGDWTAIVTDQQGEILGQQAFHVDPS